MSNIITFVFVSGCPWEWDNLTCWQAAAVGDVVEVNCPELFEFMSPDDGERYLYTM